MDGKALWTVVAPSVVFGLALLRCGGDSGTPPGTDHGTGDETTEAAGCDAAACARDCRSLGYPNGRCAGPTCVCVEGPDGGDVDADAPLDDSGAGDAFVDDLGAGDAPADELGAGDAPVDELGAGDAPTDELAAGDDAGPDPCLGVACSGHGTCYADGGTARCNCDDGYHAVGLTCVPDSGTPCEGIDCSGHGTCEVDPFIGLPECVCDPGYVAMGLSCIVETRWGCRDVDGTLRYRGATRCGVDDTIIEVCRDADGDGDLEWSFGVNCNPGTTCSGGCLTATCDVQPCPLETSCVPEAHGEPLWACVVTCDCSNCGNCDMDDFVRTGAWTLYCGNDPGPATMACNKPCPFAGHGCIPYDPPICWGLEGCMSGW